MRGLALLLVERDKRMAREIYLGNLQWNASMALLKLAKYRNDNIQSYGSFVAAQRGLEKHTNQDVDIVSILAKHLKGAGKQ